MDSHPADHPDSPTGVLIVTAVHLSVLEVPFAFSDHIQHLAKVILQFRVLQSGSLDWIRSGYELRMEN
ncbi:hypothetical protein YC2023_058313 [Brassica napus]|uniref:Uncharacterized protein n=1 Tax=Brassica oleracea var. oleracea TaxID=109376 RepID=A0A0D3CDY2_BRAOL